MAQLTIPSVFPMAQFDLQVIENSSVNQARSGRRSIYRRSPYWRARIQFAAIDKAENPGWQAYESFIHGFSSGVHYADIPLQNNFPNFGKSGRPRIGPIATGAQTLRGGNPTSLNISGLTRANTRLRIGSNVYTCQVGRIYKNATRFGGQQSILIDENPITNIVSWNGDLYVISWGTLTNNVLNFKWQRINQDEGNLEGDTRDFSIVGPPASLPQTNNMKFLVWNNELLASRLGYVRIPLSGNGRGT